MAVTLMMGTAMTTDLDAMLAALTEHAPRLRSAGVQSFTIGPDGSVTAKLAPPAELPAASEREATEEFDNVFDDPKTYGLSGRKAPGFERPDSDID